MTTYRFISVRSCRTPFAKRWNPALDSAEVDKEYGYWKKAVTRTFDWLE